MSSDSNVRQGLGLFSLVMIAIVSVDSLRNLPIAAQYGFSLISFYAFAGLMFFLPLAWISGRLAVQYPNTGGSYVWVRAAFGDVYGYLAIWLQWLYNIIWYPTIFAFITTTFASLISPGLENNKLFILMISLGLFWSISLLHCFGLRVNRWISTGGAMIGTLLPMFLMIGLAVYWVITGKPSATEFSWQALLPKASDLSNISFFSNILFSLVGLEVIAMHAGNVISPQKTYPKAIGISAIVIILSIICSSLALCIMMPAQEIGLISGLMDVLQLYFSAYHISNIATLIGVCIIIGGLAIASSWMVSLARGLHASLCTMRAPLLMKNLNKNQMPTAVLLMQAVVYSILMCSFLLFPDISSSYWMLSAIAAQLALAYYMLLFFAAIKLLRRTKQSPINAKLSIVLPIMAIGICFFGIITGFMPPDFILPEDRLKYGAFLMLGFVMIGFFPIFITQSARKMLLNLRFSVAN